MRVVPQPERDRSCGRITLDTRVAREHALYISIQDGRALVEAKRSDGGCSRAADTRKVRKRRGGTGKFAAVITLDPLGACMQVTRARVVTKARPRVHHLRKRRVRKCGKMGKANHETLVVRNDGPH